MPFLPLSKLIDQRTLSKRRTSSRERLGGRAVIYHFPPTYHFDQKMKRVGTKEKFRGFLWVWWLRGKPGPMRAPLHRQIADPFISAAQKIVSGLLCLGNSLMTVMEF